MRKAFIVWLAKLLKVNNDIYFRLTPVDDQDWSELELNRFDGVPTYYNVYLMEKAVWPKPHANYELYVKMF